MQRLNHNPSHFPQLVYHGTSLSNIESILRYGFLILNQAHPSNPEAPVIVVKHGQVYGQGIYSSRTADHSLSHMNSINTFLACAALPKRNKLGKPQRSHGNILVLPHVSQIIPLFLVDLKYLNTNICNHWFDQQNELKTDENKQIETPVVLPRTYLRKTLNYMNDDLRKNNRYQLRLFDLFD